MPMKFTKIEKPVQKSLSDLLSHYPLIIPIITMIAQEKGRTLLVGGAVRDLLMGNHVKDIDVEVHGLTSEQLESILRHFHRESCGQNIWRISFAWFDVDWSLPRTDLPDANRMLPSILF